MNVPEKFTPPPEDDQPPVLRTWNQVYLFVLVLHALLITAFYIFTHSYA